MVMRRVVWCVAVGGCALAAFAGAAVASPQSGSLKIGLVLGQSGSPFYESMARGAKVAATKFHIQLEVQGANQFSPSLEIPIVDAMSRSGVKGLVVVPTDPRALINSVKQAEAKGIAVGTVDGSLAKPVDLFNIRTQSIQGGKLAAKAVLSSVKGSGKVLIVSYQPGVTSMVDRETGFEWVINKSGRLKMLPVAYVDNDPNKAAQVVQSAYEANPDLVAVYGTNDIAANGAAVGLRNANATGKVKLVAYDADPQEVSNLRRGVFDALVVQAAWQEGYMGVREIAAYLRGTLKKSAIHHQQWAPLVIATRANLKSPLISRYIYK